MEDPEKREGMSVAWVGSKAEVRGWILLRRKVQRRKGGCRHRHIRETERSTTRGHLFSL